MRNPLLSSGMAHDNKFRQWQDSITYQTIPVLLTRTAWPSSS